MKKNMAMIAGLSLFMSAAIFAANTATQTITFSIEPISEISISGDPPPLVASQAVAGSNLSNVLDSSTFYAVTTNGSAEKVVVSLDSAMPVGTTLSLTGQAPTGATSVGQVSLDVTSQNLVTGITQVAQSNLQLTYDFEATATAGTLSSTTRVVTFTLAP